MASYDPADSDVARWMPDYDAGRQTACQSVRTSHEAEGEGSLRRFPVLANGVRYLEAQFLLERIEVAVRVEAIRTCE